MADLLARVRDPYSFPQYHWRDAKQLARWTYRGLRHPSRRTFGGLGTSGSLVHCVWWTFSDLGWSVAWRPYCWVRRCHTPHHCDAYYEQCTVCAKLLWSRSRHGSPNPYRGVDRAPLRKLKPTPEAGR